MSPRDSVPCVRIGEGAGYSGAWLGPAVQLATRGALDYLTFECLGERTVALAQANRLTNPARGYDPFLARRMRAVLGPCHSNGTRVITNAGAANPEAGGACVIEVAHSLGLRGLRVGVVTGDDVLSSLDLDTLKLDETGMPLRELAGRILSANAYIGAEPLVQALDQGAHVVIAGRVADPSLALAALRYGFGWGADDWRHLGAGTAVGHLTECGPQVTGGYFAEPGSKEVPQLSNLGYPIAECRSDGSAVVTKLPGTGGVVSTATCTEQLLYEVHDPAAYLTPDVTADFSGVHLEAQGADRILVTGATGRPAPETLKVTVGYRDGFLGESQISYGGSGCLARARLAGEIVVQRLTTLGLDLEDLQIQIIGWDSLYRRSPRADVEPPEVRLRVVARAASREDAESIGEELEGLWIAGPYGGGGAARSIREVVAVGSVYLPRDRVHTALTILEV